MNEGYEPMMMKQHNFALANPPRATSSLLHKALDALADRRAQWLRHEEQAWASITFAGMRHSIALRFTGVEAMNAGEHFITALPDYEFTIPRQIVAEAAIRRVNHVMQASKEEPEPFIEVELEILLLDEG